MGENCSVIDSAEQCAQDVARRLGSCGLLQSGSQSTAWLRCYVSDNSPKFAALASRFLGVSIDSPVVISPEMLVRGNPDTAAQEQSISLDDSQLQLKVA